MSRTACSPDETTITDVDDPAGAAGQSLRTGPPSTHGAGAGAWRPLSAASPAAELVGREAETAALNALVEKVRCGLGGSLILTGHVGIGKSSLLRVATQQASARNLLVLSARGARNETELAFATLHQLVRPLLESSSGLPGAQREVLSAAFGCVTSAADRFGIALATLDLLAEAASDRPMLLICDDAQWFDPSSADVLAFVARRVDTEPIGLLASVRTGGQDPFELTSLPRLVVKGLPPVSAAELLRAAHPALSEPRRRRVLTRAEGNPLALMELPKTLDEIAVLVDEIDQPVAVSDILEHAFSARVSSLPRETQLLLLVASADHTCTVRDLLTVAEAVTGESHPLSSLQHALDAKLVTLVGGKIRFEHPLVISAIYQHAPISIRHAVHLALARQELTEEDRRIWHRAHAAIGTDEDVAAQLDELALRTADLGAGAGAVTALTRAAELTPPGLQRVDRLLRAAETAVAIGRSATALDLLRREDLSRFGVRCRVRALVVEALAEFAPAEGSGRLGLIIDAATDLCRTGDAESSINLLWNSATKCWRASSSEANRQRLLRATRDLRLPSDHILVLTIESCLAAPSRANDAATKLRSLREVGDEEDLASMAWRSCAWTFLGDVQQAAQDAEQAVRLARSAGQLALVAQLGLVQSRAAFGWGDLGDAAAAAVEAERAARDIGWPEWATLARVQASLVEGLRGDYAGARSQVERAEQDPAIRLDRYALAEWQHALGLAAMADGACDAAYQHLHEIVDKTGRAHHYALRYRVIGDLLEAARAVDRLGEARALVEPLLADIADTTSPQLLQAKRQADVVLARPGEVERAFTAALAAGPPRWPLMYARTQLAYGSWLRRQRRFVQAREQLRSAREIFDRTGVIGWSRTARRELSEAGESSDDARPGHWSSLTPQEWQIAKMAASGLTNQEIGRQLYLSHRTVASHLYHLFPKLGITARSQLRVILSEADSDH